MTSAVRSTRQAIIDAARELFAEHGYSAPTVREIAEHAGYSPAMVIKTMGSKAELYVAAAPRDPQIDDNLPDEPPGYRMVRRIVDRRDTDASDPWAMASFLIQDSPDPESAREDTRNRYVTFVAQQIGDTSPELRRTQYVVCALLGLATGIRTFGALADVPATDLIARYGAIVQQIIDDH
ncbi:TetR family transcriptional regulator [Rhodococcus olei]|uniref:TetR family transcriptional regulator n=1 Tax=Rhodococcus olei TaxID=2161675 RepID=A0ABP8NYW4_9NOCA